MRRKPMHSGSPRRRPSYRRRWSSATSRMLCCGTSFPSWYGTNSVAAWGGVAGKVCSTSISTVGGLSCCWMWILDIWKRSPFICLFLFPSCILPRTSLALDTSILVGIDVLIECLYGFSLFIISTQNNMLKKMDNLMAAVKTAELSEVNHGKNEHTALGRGLCFSLSFALCCLLTSVLNASPVFLCLLELCWLRPYF